MLLLVAHVSILRANPPEALAKKTAQAESWLRIRKLEAEGTSNSWSILGHVLYASEQFRGS